MKPFINISVGLIMALGLIHTAFPQTGTQNYVQTEVARKPVKKESDFSALNDLSERYRAVSYIDGIGRKMQQIEVKASPDSRDMVSFSEYDEFGRIPREYIPYESTQLNNGHFRIDPVTEQALYFGYMSIIDSVDRNFPFADKIFEASPLDRVKEQGKPGKDWQPGQGHTIKNSFRKNQNNIGIDYVRKWTFDPQTGQFVAAGFYGWGQLLVTEMEDENGSMIIEYKDKFGRIILRRTQIDASSVHSNPHSWANVYYFYDLKGNLRHVLQPEGVKDAVAANWDIYNGNILDNFAFSYNYNDRNQVVEKKIPGAGWTYMVYDPLDRLVLTQDAAMRANNPNNWLFQKYDALNRPIMSGVYSCPLNITRVQMQEEVTTGCHNGTYQLNEDRSGINFNQQHGYTNQAFPFSNHITAWHQVIWYDHYDFNLDGIQDRIYQFEPKVPGNTSFLRVKGKPTGTQTWILNPDTDMPTSLLSVTFYDSRDREVQIFSQNHLGGNDVTTRQYDFSGKLLKSVLRHVKGMDEIMVMKEFSYDHRGRLLEVYQTNAVNFDEDDPILLVQYEYDNLGRMEEKNLHSTDQGAHFLQSIDYQYNIQGWMTDINQVNFQCGEGSTNDPVIGIRLNEINVDFLPVTESGNSVIGITVKDQKVVTFLNLRSGETYEKEAFMHSEKNISLNSVVGTAAFNSQFASVFENIQVVEGNYFQIRDQITSDMFSFFEESGLDSPIVNTIAEQVATTMENEFENIYGDDDHEDLFGMKFHYNEGFTSQNPQAKSLFDGNLSGLEWQSVSDCGIKGYGFEYDDMDRLKEAHYAEKSSNGNWSVNMNRYSVQNIQYDANGNIQSLSRNGYNGVNYGNIDDLTYTYQGNRLIKVVDNVANNNSSIDQFIDGMNVGNDYSYDPSGNLTHDLNKGISVNYNHLHKPSQIDFMNGDQLTYTYDAAGNKLRKKVSASNSTQKDYVMGFVYLDTVLAYFGHEEGRVMVDADGFDFQYNLKDHLGNVRLSFHADGNGSPELLQEDHYYPFGMRLGGLSYQSGLKNDYLYNGKELEEELDLGWYDYGFRWYMADVGRFVSVDPLAENFQDISTYVYALNNPVNLVDPDGRAATDPPYKINSGVLSGQNVTTNITKTTYRPPMKSIKGIVLHRTVSSTASSAINKTMGVKGYTGFHAVVHKDGQITQVNNFKNRANHAGNMKGSSGINNYNSIGIEVVGMSLDADGNPTTRWQDTEGWELLTSEQIESTANLVFTLMQEYDLSIDDIFPHEDVSEKTEGEGRTVLNSILDQIQNLIQERQKQREADLESEIFEIHKQAERSRNFYYQY
ncbi:MAG: N-acetylmuramoyl-L-alanine amidase [Bacteroidetes bacterium]|nr:N-acetylmuramoyl-L-alanine amidase [Bacteroidota bacterium]